MKMMKRKDKHFGIQAGLFLVVCLFCLVLPGYSQNNPPSTPARSDEDLLKATQNPVADLISVPIQNITNFNSGPYHRNDNAISLQPVIPMALSENWLLITRIIQPIAWRPYLDQKSGGKFGLGDMSPTFFLAPRKPGKVIWGAGPAMVIPTATDRSLGEGKFSLGPSAVALVQPGHWTLGALASNVWSVAGSGGRPSVNRMSLQYFIVYNLKHDWYLTSSPTMAANWRESRSNRWLVPVGGGIGRLITVAGKPIDLSASLYYNAVKPEGGPKWQLNLQMGLLFPK